MHAFCNSSNSGERRLFDCCKFRLQRRALEGDTSSNTSEVRLLPSRHPSISPVATGEIDPDLDVDVEVDIEKRNTRR